MKTPDVAAVADTLDGPTSDEKLDPYQILVGVDELRASLCLIQHWAEDNTFRTTFSVGIAGSQNSDDPGRFAMATERTLERARAAGGNTVILEGH